jgi:hypothetical protein
MIPIMIDPTFRSMHTGRLWVTPGFTIRIDLGDPRQPPELSENEEPVYLSYRPEKAEQIHRLNGMVAKVFSRAGFVESAIPFW